MRKHERNDRKSILYLPNINEVNEGKVGVLRNSGYGEYGGALILCKPIPYRTVSVR